MLRKITIISVVAMGLMLISCNSEKGTADGEIFGQGVSLASTVPVGDVFTKVDELNGKVVRVSGTISDLCKHKGCWMQVRDGENVLTVRFKDEAFILPATATGRNVDFEGLLIAEKVSNPLGSRSACAESGEHSGGEACESERAEKTIKAASDMRFTMVATGLVLL